MPGTSRRQRSRRSVGPAAAGGPARRTPMKRSMASGAYLHSAQTAVRPHRKIKVLRSGEVPRAVQLKRRYNHLSEGQWVIIIGVSLSAPVDTDCCGSSNEL